VSEDLSGAGTPTDIGLLRDLDEFCGVARKP
jgi:hypothetical protein